MISIIATYYQGVDTDEEFIRFINSLEKQSFKDFELIVLHDGTLLKELPITEFKYVFEEVGNKKKNWFGHNLRNRGLRLSEGEYIIHTNVDNVFNKDGLKNIIDYIKNNPQDSHKLLISKIIMKGMNEEVMDNGNIKRWYDHPRDYSKEVILKGTPAYGSIDLMQVCAHKDCWKKGWFDWSEKSDSQIIYPDMAKKYGFVNINNIIGEHY